jgi:hypothetical protein
MNALQHNGMATDAILANDNISDGDKRKAFLRFVNSSLSRAALANMMHLAKKKVGKSVQTILIETRGR